MTARRRSDVFSVEKRSAIMRAVKSSDTAPEIALRRALFATGLRYRINVKTLPGKPDLVFPRFNAAIFVHGCFWHGHDCARGRRIPKSNAAYWRAKISRNVKRDCDTLAALQRLGWRTKVSWECDLKDILRESTKIARWLTGAST
jgi:DNA mismatch endonuclease (patch repair protein)